MGLFSSGVPTAKFNAIGDTCSGTIVDIGQQQRTELVYDPATKTYRNGDLMFWSGGRPVAGADVDPRTGQPNQPVMDHVVTVDTGITDENGNSERRIFVKGKAELASIKAACTAAGVRDIEVGGRLVKTWMSGAGGTADPRVYAYQYAPPAANGETPGGPRPVKEIVPEVLDRLARAHASSPVLNRAKVTTGSVPNPGFEEEIPF